MASTDETTGGVVDQIVTETFHRVSSTGMLEVLSSEDAARARPDGDDLLFVHYITSDRSLLESRLAQWNLHPTVLRDLTDDVRSSHVDSLRGVVYFDLPMMHGGGVDVGYATIVCLPNVLISIQGRRFLESEEVVAEIKELLEFQQLNIPGILHQLLNLVTEAQFKPAIAIRARVRALRHKVEENPDAVKSEDILTAKREASDLAQVIEDQIYCAGSLVQIDSAAFPLGKVTDYYRDLAGNMEQVHRTAVRAELIAEQVQQHFTNYQQKKANQRLNVLTIVQAVFLPLTLLAGIYGMNWVYMPELSWKWGYPLMIAAMVAITAGELAYFKWRGWFG